MYCFLSSAHLAASEGHLPCLKFIVCAGASIDHTLNARNDQVHKLQNHILFCLVFVVVAFGISVSYLYNVFFYHVAQLQGDTPKNLCQQFYKKDCIDYLNAVGGSICSPRSTFYTSVVMFSNDFPSRQSFYHLPCIFIFLHFSEYDLLHPEDEESKFTLN